MWAYHCIFSHFSLISQARRVKLRHFISLKPSTWYGKCREAMEKCSRLFLTAQWAKKWANHPNFSHFGLISQARKVKLSHFKSIVNLREQVYPSWVTDQDFGTYAPEIYSFQNLVNNRSSIQTQYSTKLAHVGLSWCRFRPRCRCCRTCGGTWWPWRCCGASRR